MIEIRKYVWGDKEYGYSLSDKKRGWWCHVQNNEVYSKGITTANIIIASDSWIIKDHQLPSIAKHGFIQNIFKKKK